MIHVVVKGCRIACGFVDCEMGHSWTAVHIEEEASPEVTVVSNLRVFYSSRMRGSVSDRSMLTNRMDSVVGCLRWVLTVIGFEKGNRWVG